MSDPNPLAPIPNGPFGPEGGGLKLPSTPVHTFPLQGQPTAPVLGSTSVKPQPFQDGFTPVFPQIPGDPGSPWKTLVNDFAMDDFFRTGVYNQGQWQNVPEAQLWERYYRSEAIVGVGPYATTKVPVPMPTHPASFVNPPAETLPTETSVAITSALAQARQAIATLDKVTNVMQQVILNGK